MRRRICILDNFTVNIASWNDGLGFVPKSFQIVLAGTQPQDVFVNVTPTGQSTLFSSAVTTFEQNGTDTFWTWEGLDTPSQWLTNSNAVSIVFT